MSCGSARPNTLFNYFLDIFERLANFLIFLLLAILDVGVSHNRTDSSH